jgi:asparagine synthase (glutamine-hydrolysing)
MCGINGVISYQRPVDMAVIEQMNRVIKHRGPDGEGVYHSENNICSLGHVRLSIIDVEGSKQPLCNEDGSVWITFNGEIYNYRELRQRLIQRGHKFQTHGDTETLVHLYEEYGTEMLSHLYGMFAFAIWDTKQKSLFLVRDRMGIKPVFYYYDNKTFIFSSEQKGVLQHPDVNIQPSEEAIWHYLTFRSVPAPGTLYKGIKKLLPGHYLYLSENGITGNQYWDIPLSIHPDGNIDDREVIEKTEVILKKSIQRRLISDVPLGSFLSGGVDSSLIVAMMSQMTSEPVKTFTVGFENFKSNEAPYAKIVADQYKTEHHELILKEDIFLDHLEQLTVLRDAPLSEPADIPLYLLSKMANREVKVLLSGEGCDELFAGYPKYQYDGKSDWVNWMPEKLKSSLINVIPSKYRKIEVALKAMFESNYSERWPLWFAPFSIQEKRKLMVNAVEYDNPIADYVSRYQLNDSLSSFLFCDCKVWLPDNLLDRGDRMTMGAGIEGRVPFLDHDLVEYAFSLPDRYKIRGKMRKWVIKQIAMQYLPDHIVNRPKAGFVMPLAQWFRGKMKDYCYDTICSSNLLPEAVISKRYCTTLLDDHCSGRKDYYLQIWTLLGLALWFKNCIRKQ